MSFDQTTAGKAFEYPGSDPRQWVSYGLVNADTADQPSVVFDNEDGKEMPYPVVMVTLEPSGTVVPCRVSSQVAGNGEGEWYPFVEGDEVLVVIPEGNERSGCVIIGRLNQSKDKWPRQVAGNDATKNTFGFKRMIAPYIVETQGGYLVRSAKTGAFLGIDPVGQVTVSNGDKGALHLGTDFLGLATGDNACLVQLVPGKNQLILQADQVSAVLENDLSQILTPGQLIISTSGANPVSAGHAITVEQVLAVLFGVVQALGPFFTVPLTPPQVIACVVAGLSVGSTATIAPFITALTTALATPPDPTGIKPGVGRAGFLF